jgi:hypothetical protein
MPLKKNDMPLITDKKAPEIDDLPSLRYHELKDFCKIIGIEMLELAKPLGYTPESFYVVRNMKKHDTDSFIELARLDRIIAVVGAEDYATALEELRLTKEERENPRNTRRITWDESKKMLKHCGIPAADFARAILLSPTRVYHLMGWYRRRLIPLRDVHALRKLLGEKNFERALARVRK